MFQPHNQLIAVVLKLRSTALVPQMLNPSCETLERLHDSIQCRKADVPSIRCDETRIQKLLHFPKSFLRVPAGQLTGVRIDIVDPVVRGSLDPDQIAPPVVLFRLPSLVNVMHLHSGHSHV